MPQQPNGIGQFVIGESPIGDQPFYWVDTLYSQYSNSTVLMAWLNYFSQWIDANQNIDAWYDQMWNVATAIGYGLDVWGRIVGVTRVLNVSGQKYLGFDEATNVSADPFGQSPFYSGQQTSNGFSLSDDAFRMLILAKAAANIWNGSIPGLNAILQILFPSQICYVTDGLNKTMTYTFAFILTPVQVGIISSGVLPRPSGVSTSIVQI